MYSIHIDVITVLDKGHETNEGCLLSKILISGHVFWEYWSGIEIASENYKSCWEISVSVYITPALFF